MNDDENTEDEVVYVEPYRMRNFSNEQAAWYESDAEKEQATASAAEKRRLLQWVRRQIGRRLGAYERQCVELCYFRALTYAEIARETGTNPTTVSRAVERAIRILRRAAIRSRLRSPEQCEGLSYGNRVFDFENEEDVPWWWRRP